MLEEDSSCGAASVDDRIQAHRYPPLCPKGRHSLQLFVWYIYRYRKSRWVGVTKLVVIIHLRYPPALVGYTLS